MGINIFGAFSTASLASFYTESMPTPTATIEYMKLSVSERIQLVEDIWDSIAAEAPDTVELSQAITRAVRKFVT